MNRTCRVGVGLLLALLVVVARAAPDYRTLAVGLVEDYALPRYAVLAGAFEAQKNVLNDFCEVPDEAGLTAARAAFHDSMDAWQGIQHITAGPIQLLFRRERINHWPERRNAVARGLNALLRAADSSAITPARLAEASVAVQGLPALERLLFDEEALDAFGADTDDARFRCKLATAIAANLTTIAREVVAEWRDDALPVLKAGESHPIYFRDAGDLSARLLTDLQGLLQLMIDLKLAPVLGDAADVARPLRVENRRSLRGARNLRLNLEAAWAMVAGGEAAGFGPYLARAELDLYESLMDAFAAAGQTAATLPVPLTTALSEPAPRAQVVDFLETLRALRALVRESVPAALGLTLGFNAMDGD